MPEGRASAGREEDVRLVSGCDLGELPSPPCPHFPTAQLDPCWGCSGTAALGREQDEVQPT